MGNAEGSLFGFDSYVQIAACGTYRCRSQPLAPFSDGSRVALHVVGMLLAVVLPVGGARSVLFLLQRITPAKVIRVPHPPVLIGFPLLLAATVQSATGPLPLFEPRMGMKPTTTERTPLPREHTFPRHIVSFVLSSVSMSSTSQNSTCSFRSASSQLSHRPSISQRVSASLRGSFFSFLSTRKPP